MLVRESPLGPKGFLSIFLRDNCALSDRFLKMISLLVCREALTTDVERCLRYAIRRRGRLEANSYNNIE